MIYLDNSATTQMSTSTCEIYNKFAHEFFFNPSSIYYQGINVKNSIEEAKNIICKTLGIEYNDNLIFTSGATESNNLAILGSYKKNIQKVVFSIGEHPSVYNVAMQLKKQGTCVEFINLQPNGEIDYFDLEQKLDETVGLISIMHVNNETGAINDLNKISSVIKHKCPNAIFHSDGVQAFGKISLNMDYFGVDMYTISAHKAFGPKGVGALYVKNKQKLNPIVFGGGQEFGIRSGTENVAGIMAFADAVKNFGNIKESLRHVQSCKDAFLKEIDLNIVTVNSFHLPHVLSLSINGINGETLVHMLESKEILISTGSACSSKKSGNRVLKAMGVADDSILGSVRVSFSKNNTIEECSYAGKELMSNILELKDKLK